jgi:transposase-like protein
MQKDRDVRERRRWSAEEKRELLERWKASGEPASEFARKEGLSPGNLWRWQRDGVEAEPEPAPRARAAITFAPVQVSRAGAAVVSNGVGRPWLEVVVHDGLRVRVLEGADMDAASRFVLALSGRAAC